MVDYAQARRMMVDGQVRTADVTDLRIIAAMLEVPRERFAPGREAIAYLDADLPVASGGAGRALLKPMVFAKLVQAAGIGPDDKVLDVGCATGYSTAVLARLAGHVVALDEDTQAAQAMLAGLPNVTVVAGALNAGWPKEAPYDVIMIEGAAEVVPEKLLDQLKDGGRLLAVVGVVPMGKATIYQRSGGHITAQPLFDAAAPALPGFAKPPAFVF
jgi:protein-L-isoaspartate(D-aspartate) O-methyltransferase